MSERLFSKTSLFFVLSEGSHSRSLRFCMSRVTSTHPTVKNLMIRTTIAAVLGQILLTLSGSNLVGIFFLFALGWIAFELIDKGFVWAVPLIMLTAEYFKVDYGWYGIATLVLFYLLRGKRMQQCFSFVFIDSPFSDQSVL